jgi:hypothetical protein
LNTMIQESYTRLIITSNVYSAEKIAEMLGLSFDRAWRKGDLRPKTMIVEPSNGWLIASRLSKDQPLLLHVEDLLTRLTPYAERLAALRPACDVEFSCVYYGESSPELNFDPLVLKRLVAMNCSFDIDVYII